MKDYGVEVYKHGVVFHGDGRKRRTGPLGWKHIESPVQSRSHYRGVIRAFSEASRKRLEFSAANVAGLFHSLLTLTYHADAPDWAAAERNHRMVQRSKADLNRFLSNMRRKLGPYLWVQEFQERGVIHYHVLCQGTPSEQQVTVAWLRATGGLDDLAAWRHGVKVEEIKSERAARSYLGRYMGKARQKVLPPGVSGAGRWWGRSLSLQLLLLEEVVAGEAGFGRAIPEGMRIHRCLRKYVSKRFKGKFRGGMFLDWGGELAGKLQAMAAQLKEHYGKPRRVEELLDDFGWEPVEFTKPPVEILTIAMKKRGEQSIHDESDEEEQEWKRVGWR